MQKVEDELALKYIKLGMIRSGTNVIRVLRDKMTEEERESKDDSQAKMILEEIKRIYGF